MKQKEVLEVTPSKEIIIGDAKAPVKLVVFGDYESEACAKASEAIGQLLTELEGSINLVYRHFPLTRIHQKAHKAAEAAIGAAQEGKFWEMHNLLFSHRLNLGVISLKGYAREAGVKDKKFLDHLINSDWGWYVQDDLKDGIALGVVDIPVVFINGERMVKEATYKNLKAIIDPLLKAAKSAPAKPAAAKVVAEKPVEEEAIEEKPVVEKVVAEKPVAEKPVAEKAATVKPVAEKPAPKTATEKPATEKVVAAKPVVEKLVAKKPVAEKKAAAKPAAKEKKAA